MSAIGAKLLNFSLAVMLAIPFGSYCDQKITSSPVSQTTGHCCHSNDQLPKAPVAATKSCCCQERLTATQVTKSRKRVVETEFPTVGASVAANESTQIGAASRSHAPALLATGKHSAQTLLCVWRL
jgi:hypothetical protein